MDARIAIAATIVLAALSTAPVAAQVLSLGSTTSTSASSFGPGGNAGVAGGAFQPSPGTYAPRYGRPGDLTPRPFGFGYTDSFLPSGLMFLVPAPSDAYAGRRVEPTHGALTLQVAPAHAQVYVDGAYAGRAADFTGDGQLLREGPHSIEIRAEGYEPHAFQRRIVAGETNSYRQELWAVRRDAPEVPRFSDTVPVKRTFYFVDNCYAGNTPPTPAKLPAGCRAENTRIVEYTVRVAR